MIISAADWLTSSIKPVVLTRITVDLSYQEGGWVTGEVGKGGRGVGAITRNFGHCLFNHSKRTRQNYYSDISFAPTR
jgi:hypothetical protein